MTIDPRLLELLCCPVCRQALEQLADDAGLRCGGCRRVYPVVDGILDMLVEDAKIEGTA